MEESGSEGLDDLIKAEVGPGKFFEGVDAVCISDNYWLNDRTVSYLLAHPQDVILKSCASSSHASPTG